MPENTEAICVYLFVSYWILMFMKAVLLLLFYAGHTTHNNLEGKILLLLPY